MARKIDKKLAPAAEPSSAAEDLSVLKPEVTITVAGRRVTVREYSFFEGLEVAHRAAAFIADMLGMCADGTLRYAAVRRLFGVHQAVVVEIAAQAGDVEPEWLRALGEKDQKSVELYLSTWFTVNSGFFLREAAVEIEEVRVRERMRRPTPSSTSSPASAPQASATSTASAASPNGS